MGVVIDKLLGKALLHQHNLDVGASEPNVADLVEGEVTLATVGAEQRMYTKIGDALYYLVLTAVSTVTSAFLLETGDTLLLETGDKILIE